MPSRSRKTPADIQRDERAIALIRAENSFLTDPDQRNIEYWYHLAVRELMTIDQFREHVAINQWESKRQAFRKGVQAAWLKQQAELLLSRSQEMKEIMNIRQDVTRLLQPIQTEDGISQPFEVKSYEGLIGAFIKLDQQIEAKRQLMSHQIVPMLEEAEQGRDPEKTKIPLDGNEIRAIAHHILKLRRIRRRNELGIPQEEKDIIDVEPDDDGDEKAGIGGSDPPEGR